MKTSWPLNIAFHVLPVGGEALKSMFSGGLASEARSSKLFLTFNKVVMRTQSIRAFPLFFVLLPTAFTKTRLDKQTPESKNGGEMFDEQEAK